MTKHEQGKSYHTYYVKLFGTTNITENNLDKMSRLLDVNKHWVKECLFLYKS